MQSSRLGIGWSSPLARGSRSTFHHSADSSGSGQDFRPTKFCGHLKYPCNLCQVVVGITMRGVNPLRQLVIERLDALGISQRQAATRSQGLVQAMTIGRIVRGETTRVTESTIAGLALALDVREKAVIAAAAATAQPAEWVNLSADFAKLTPELQAKVITAMQDALAEHEATIDRRRAAARPHSRVRRK